MEQPTGWGTKRELDYLETLGESARCNQYNRHIHRLSDIELLERYITGLRKRVRATFNMTLVLETAYRKLNMLQVREPI